MTTIINYGAGGGQNIESEDTTKAKVFLIKFLNQARTVINNVDIWIKIEEPYHCPPVYLREDKKRYQVDAAVIFPGFDKYNFAIEIDGSVGHKHKLKDEARDEYIFENHKIPVFRLKLEWLKEWRKYKDYCSMFDEIIYQHQSFKYGKLPKNPLFHLAYPKRRELFSND